MNEQLISYIIEMESVSKEQKDNYMYEVENELYGDEYSNEETQLISSLCY